MSDALATSNRAQVRFIEEDAYGKTPAANTAAKFTRAVRFTGESLAFAITKAESGEIRDDRQTTDLIETGANASGGINFELSYREFDILIAAALQTIAVPYGEQAAGVGQGIGEVFEAEFTANTITNTGAALVGDDAFTTLQRGQWMRVNTDGVNDNALVRISSTVAPTAQVITLDPSTKLEVGTGTVCTLSSTRFSNGTLQKSFTIERALMDVGQFFTYRGMTLSKMTLKIASGSITTGSLEFMGKDGVRDIVTMLPGPVAPSFEFDVQNGVSGVGYVLEGGVPLDDTFIKSLDISIDNSLRQRDAVGTLGSVSIGSGTFKVTGTCEVYLKDGRLYDKFRKNQRTSLQFVTRDSFGNGYAFQVPAAKYGDAKMNANSKDQDVMLSMPWTAIRDTVTGKTLLIDRYGD